jgi:hypothetical protein
VLLERRGGEECTTHSRSMQGSVTKDSGVGPMFKTRGLTDGDSFSDRPIEDGSNHV